VNPAGERLHDAVDRGCHLFRECRRVSGLHGEDLHAGGHRNAQPCGEMESVGEADLVGIDQPGAACELVQTEPADTSRAGMWQGPVSPVFPGAVEWMQSVTTCVTLAGVAIKGFRHKGLERFFASGSRAGIQAKHADRLRLILGRLNVSTSVRDMNLPGLDLHELRGNRKGTWAVTVSGNWRVTFTCTGKGVERVDYEDYH
jgi:proteic killer suppression protein